jgi:hypothetical protein
MRYSPTFQARHHETRVNFGHVRLYERQLEPGESPRFGDIRLSEIFTFILHVFGASLSDDNFGRDVLREVLNQLALNGATPEIMRRCGLDLLPEIGDDDSLDDLIKGIGTGRKRTANDIARALGIDYQLRTLLDLRTIGAADVSKTRRDDIQKQKRAADKRWKREKAGAKPQAGSARRTKPWEAMCISRSTYYAQKKRAAQNAKNQRSDHFGTHTLPSFPRTNRSDQGTEPPRAPPCRTPSEHPQQPVDLVSEAAAVCAPELVLEKIARCGASMVMCDAWHARNLIEAGHVDAAALKRIAELDVVLGMARAHLRGEVPR